MDPKPNVLYWEVVEEENGTSKVLQILNKDRPQGKASSNIQSEREQLEPTEPGSMCPVSTCTLNNPDIIVDIKEEGDFWQEDPTKEENVVSQYVKQDGNYKNWPWWPQGSMWQEGYLWKQEEMCNYSGNSLEESCHPKIYLKSEQEVYPTPTLLVETAEPRPNEKQHECERCFSFSCNVMGHPQIFTEPNYSAFPTHGAPTQREKHYPCKDCGKSFSRKSTLINHQVVHTGDKPHGCCKCGKHFSTRSSLLTHQKIHTGEKPHQCHYCGKSFRVKSSLTIHQRIHTGEKPFPCPICEKRFNERARLVYHYRTHTGEQPYQCSSCGKRFSVRSSLVKHERVHSRGN